MLDLAERQLQEPLAESAERCGIAGGQEAVGALPVGVVLDSLARERLGNLTRGLLRREDQRDAAPEHALEDRADQRVVRAAEDDRVDPGRLQRLRVVAHSIRRLGAERLVALDQRYEARAGDREEADAGVERVDELGIPAGGDRRLRRHQADPAVARREHGGVGLGRDHADDRDSELLLQLWERGRRRCVARRDDELDPLRFEEVPELARVAADLRKRARPVRQPRVVAEVDEVLVRHGHEALVQDSEAAHARVEDADRSRVHRAIVERLRAGPLYPGRMGRIRIGTCSFADEALTKWFYPKALPARERLPYYAERFDTVEIDSTYYHLPEEATTGGWAERTPDDFVFHVKAFGVMTRQ